MPYQDYHTHHRRCGHAEGELRDVIGAAVDNRLAAVGLSDHAPLLHLAREDWPFANIAMPREEFPHYAAEMADLRGEFGGVIPVKLGVEADYVPGYVGAYRDLLAPYPLDYVIGSVHFVDGWSIFEENLPEGAGREDVWDRYLVLTREAAQCGLFDILGHLDCLKTKGHLPGEWNTPRLHETLDAVADVGVAIELNTSGWRKPVGECFPSLPILEMTAARGISVCLGSDAHRPQDVGADFDRAANLLRRAGYGELVGFSERNRQTLPFSNRPNG